MDNEIKIVQTVGKIICGGTGNVVIGNTCSARSLKRKSKSGKKNITVVQTCGKVIGDKDSVTIANKIVGVDNLENVVQTCGKVIGNEGCVIETNICE